MESPSSTVLFLLFFTIPLNLSKAATFDILNNCSFTVWAAAVWPYAAPGGHQLDRGQYWTIDFISPNDPVSVRGRIWGRTGCSFDENGNGRCQTGDCGGLLKCKGYGSPPNTLAEFSIDEDKTRDFYDISLVDGFNVPLEFGPEASGSCRVIRCAADITAQCPEELKAPGGCNGPCSVFGTSAYCCNGTSDCRPTNYSKFFKNSCPDAYSYPMDDATSTFTCPPGNMYRIVFCPSGDERPAGLMTGFGRVEVTLAIPEI